jgi:hypothetical protein
MKMSKNAQFLAFHRMAFAQDRYCGRKVTDVGSVSWVPLKASITVFSSRCWNGE